MIKISIREITSAGLDIEQTVGREGIGLSDEEIDLRSPLEIKAHLERINNIVTADVHVAVDFGSTCARCLKDLHQNQEFDYHFNFDVEPKVEYIDLGEEIRQEIIMENPTRLLCKKDCKGICPGCGVNLNEEQCKCK